MKTESVLFIMKIPASPETPRCEVPLYLPGQRLAPGLGQLQGSVGEANILQDILLRRGSQGFVVGKEMRVGMRRGASGLACCNHSFVPPLLSCSWSM